MVIVGLSWTLDHMDLFSMAYGEYMCWIGTINGSSIFFAGPICFVLLTNGLMYAKVIYKRVLATKPLENEGLEGGTICLHTYCMCAIVSRGLYIF